MSRKISLNITGHCPTLTEEYDIDIDYSEILMLGQSSPGYKKLSFYCYHADEQSCPIANYCPIFVNAPNNPYLSR